MQKLALSEARMALQKPCTRRAVFLVGGGASTRGMALHLMIELLGRDVGQIIAVEERELPPKKKLEPFLLGHDEYWEPPTVVDPMQALAERLIPEPETPPRAFQKGSFFPAETVAKDKRGYNKPRRRR